ncbi:MAG: uroporphyrinogen-III synthase [Gemmatimonadales bacterium]
MTASDRTTVAIGSSEGGLEGLDAALASLGCATVRVPLIRFERPRSWGPLDRLLRWLDGRGTLVVTSPRGANAVAGRIRVLDPRPRPATTWAVGPATGAALGGAVGPFRDPGPLASDRSHAVQLARAMLRDGAGGPVGFARGDRAGAALPRTLAAGGVEVRTAVAYRTLAASRETLEALCGVDLIVVASPSAARVLAKNALMLPIVAIGPTTARAARTRGLDVRATAATADPSGVVAAVRAAMAMRGSRRSNPARRPGSGARAMAAS